MKIKPERLEQLAELLITSYRSKNLIVSAGVDAMLKKKVADIVAKNFAEEEAIEEEARRVIASHAQAVRDMDSYKMFQLAKQKLAAKKGFIL